MRDLAEAETFTQPHTPGSSWMQITFTLDVGRYRMLRDWAEVEHLTVPDFVREIVKNALKGHGAKQPRPWQ